MIGPKTRAYLRSKKDPVGSVWEFMQGMELTATEQSKAAVDKAVEKLTRGLQEEIQRTHDEKRRAINAIAPNIAREVNRQLSAHIQSIPHIKGEPGYTPIKGKDYTDGSPGFTPTAGVDYPTPDMVQMQIGALIASLYEDLKKEGLTRKQIVAEITSMKLDPESIARSLETLKDQKRLDFNSLKNRPGEPVQDTKRHTLHRGGAGAQVYEYDLSSLCDGNTRVFTVPSNTRIIHVECTDAPSGILRKTTDWTGTGTTTLTINNAIVAPTQGATLSILYVV